MKDYLKTQVVIRKRTEFGHQKEDLFLNSLATVSIDKVQEYYDGNSNFWRDVI